MIRAIFSFLFFLLLLHNITNAQDCNLFAGKWIAEEGYPPYDSSTCPFIEHVFNCEANGRPDRDYLVYQWQPQSCMLKMFDAAEFFEKFRGKSIMFVGDSLSRDQYASLLCLLYTSAPGIKYEESRVGDISTVTFMDYDVQVKLDRNVFLVDLVPEKIGRVLKLDSVARKAADWLASDVLVFNTYAWWGRTGPQQPWDFIELGGRVMKDMDRKVAFKTALKTWAQWVDTNVDPAKTKVFFQTVSPSHYNGSEWGAPGKNCKGETVPVMGSEYAAALPPAYRDQREIIGTIKNPGAVTVLDITHLSQFRKDGHPSIYGAFGVDCLHWCVGGVTDTWNQILATLLFSPSPSN